MVGSRALGEAYNLTRWGGTRQRDLVCLRRRKNGE